MCSRVHGGARVCVCVWARLSLHAARGASPARPCGCSGTQLTSASLPFDDAGMRWYQSRQDESKRLPVSSCFPQQSLSFFFSLPEDDASF